MATGLEKVSFHAIPKRDNNKECSKYGIIALISPASKVTPKILQARLQQYVNWELLDVQAGFQRGGRTRGEIGNICWVIEKVRELKKKKKVYFWFIRTKLKPLTVWITMSCGKFLKRWEYQTNLTVSWETCKQVKKQQNQTWNNRLVQNWESSVTRLYIVTLFI